MGPDDEVVAVEGDGGEGEGGHEDGGALEDGDNK